MLLREKLVRDKNRIWKSGFSWIKNSREVITPLFLVTHFLERAGMEDIAKESILTMVKVKEKKTILVQVKKAFETLVANFNQDISAIIKERKEEK